MGMFPSEIKHFSLRGQISKGMFPAKEGKEMCRGDGKVSGGQSC